MPNESSDHAAAALPSASRASWTDDALVDVARSIIARADEPWPLADMAARFGLSPSAFQRRFVALIGISPKALQDAARLGRLKSALKGGSRVTDAILDAGFGSPSRVYGEAQRAFGMTLSAYRDGAPGEAIHWALRESALGPLMMAATARGVCFVQFGPDAAALDAALAREFPRARLLPSAAGQSGAISAGTDPAAASPARQLDAWIDALDAHLARNTHAPALPLDLRGTAFQHRVWRFLQGIPLGTTRSYAEVAQAIGAPKATRAVGTACGANRVAVLVPCHRVLRGDGALGGYRWGLERKRALLAAEALVPTG